MAEAPPKPPVPPKIKEIELKPEAELEGRLGDVDVPHGMVSLFQEIGLFGKLKTPPRLETMPGSFKLRRYRAGDTICRQGAAGWTAFYILTREDVESFRDAQIKISRSQSDIDLNQQTEINRSMADMNLFLKQPAPEETAQGRPTATVYVAAGRTPTVRANTGLKAFLKSLITPSPKRKGKKAQKSISIDAPVDVNMQSRTAVLREGDLFGEMSCLYRTPRSATIIADRDCYVLELLRNILEMIRRDENFKKEMDAKYKERVLGSQLRNLPLFGDLSDAQIDLLRQRVDLKTYRAGDILCDEHDRSDSIFIIRSGLVKVVKHASSLLQPLDVRDWQRLASRLLQAKDQPASAVGWVWGKLSPELHEYLGAAEPDAWPAETRQELVSTLNGLIKGPRIWDAKELGAAPEGTLAQRLADLKADPKRKFSEPEIRRNNRLLLEAIFPTTFTQRRPLDGPETILAYCGRGDIIGEMGVALNEPRSATCIAFTHPRSGLALKEAQEKLTQEEIVEVVELPAEAFWELVHSDKEGKLKARIDAVIAERQSAMKQHVEGGISAGESPIMQSPQFEKLGLVQGQKLMLIDLDRCVRCDECVSACVESHDDGRSRLFLDGPRFGKFLIPTTCRSCLDPACMIGCPVGSIHRGGNAQIVIEDWCIGCGLCARQCPYGSIQMHDIGIIAESSRGWLWTPDTGKLGEQWIHPRFNDRAWFQSRTPFRADRTAHIEHPAFPEAALGKESFLFRRECVVDRELLESEFEIILEAVGPPDWDKRLDEMEYRLWVNGHELVGTAKPKRGRREYPSDNMRQWLKPGRNVVAGRVKLPPGHQGVFFDLRLDAVRVPQLEAGTQVSYTEKAVTSRAVVCDLCSDLPGQSPACVRACPHEAAMRVDARSNFPAGG